MGQMGVWEQATPSNTEHRFLNTMHVLHAEISTAIDREYSNSLSI